MSHILSLVIALGSAAQSGRTALHHAILDGIVDNNLQMARMLIDLGADVNVKDEVSIYGAVADKQIKRVGNAN